MIRDGRYRDGALTIGVESKILFLCAVSNVTRSDWKRPLGRTITQHIADDLRSRIRAGSLSSEAPTLEELSAQYGVSLTPIRHAVRELVAQRMLIKRPNRRLVVNRAKVELRSADRINAHAIRPPQTDDVESRLRSEVIRVSLIGEAQYLREDATARQFGIGRTVVRHAFARMAGSNMLEHLPRRGWRVRAFCESDLAAYLDVREAMELKALRLSRGRLDKAVLRRMLQGNAPTPKGAGPMLDNELHRYIITQSQNPYIRDFFERHGPYYQALLDYAAPEARLDMLMAKQHRRILQAMIDDNWREARRALAHHIRCQIPVLKKLLKNIGGAATARSTTTSE